MVEFSHGLLFDIFLKKEIFLLTVSVLYVNICLVVGKTAEINKVLREWLSGGAPPCQGGGRGFDPRLALFFYLKKLSH